MKKLLLLLCTAATVPVAYAQSFHKGSLLVSLTEGATFANVHTQGPGVRDGGTVHINGDRDPLTLEYGISDRWGVGINLGGDILKINPSQLYGANTPTTRHDAIMSEFTFDIQYHFVSNKYLDASAFVSTGASNIILKGNEGDYAFQYIAKGSIMRTGIKARYYIGRRIGIMTMVSAFSTKYTTTAVEGNTFGDNYSTSIKGWAIEFGPCFRLLK